jgi:hypothetical protein
LVVDYYRVVLGRQRVNSELLKILLVLGKLLVLNDLGCLLYIGKLRAIFREVGF